MQLSQSVSILEQENNRLNQENAELRRLLGTEPSKPKDCQSCKFFLQHYIYGGGNIYVKIDAGHCVCGKRTKDRKASDKNCQYFKLGKAR